MELMGNVIWIKPWENPTADELSEKLEKSRKHKGIVCTFIMYSPHLDVVLPIVVSFN